MISKRKKVISIIITIIFLGSFSLINATSTSTLYNTDHKINSMHHSEQISLTLTAPEYQLITNQDQTHIHIQAFGSLLHIGYPKLPSKLLYIRLPMESTLTDIEIINETVEHLSGIYNIAHAGPITDTATIYTGEKQHKSSVIYPSQSIVYEGIGSYGTIPYVKIRYTPFSYHLQKNELRYHHHINLTIHYQIDRNTVQNPVEKQLIGTELRSLINSESTRMSTQSTGQTSQPLLTHDYVIITSPALEHSVRFLKHWRELTGYHVKIVNTSWIEQRYQGLDMAEEIRLFLQEHHQIWHIKHVLLVGSIKSIPMRKCYPDANNHGYSGKIPTDYYYADLTGEWDSDNDGYFGERTDDNPDFSAEIMVGRIPADDPEIVDAICQKIIDFEKTDAPWKKQSLLIGALLFLDNQYNDASYKKTDGAELMQDISTQILSPQNFQTTTLYEHEGLTTSSYDSDYLITRENVTEQWSNGYGFVNWNGHGSASATSRIVWNQDDGDNIPEHSEITSPLFINSYDTNALPNTKPAVVFSCSCQNAYPERSNNLGAELLKNGAVAFIGATRNAWGTVGWKDVSDGGASSIDYLFTKQFISNGHPIGKALYNAKFDYISQYGWDSWQSLQNLYVFNVYGDPATSFQTITDLSAPTTPALPQGTLTGPIQSDLTFTSTSTDADDHSLYYQWEWGDGTTSPWIGPYTSGEPIETTHQWHDAGSYSIRVRSRDITGEKSNYSDPRTVHITSPQISVQSISSRVGSTEIIIENTGNHPATAIEWSVDIQDGLVLKSQSEGTISQLDVGEQMTVRHRFFFGFGLPTMTIRYQSEKLPMMQSSYTGLLIGPIMFI